ncbi:MAG: DUF1772 domain-containing protein [Bdellovibrionales bacterium]|nr:DUF1772 domain-containing protein [Bdellovibrionales bacterium]NQZ18239.1 DUF1772 domain-containing protein [Bdellovibrionales bacterium]
MDFLVITQIITGLGASFFFAWCVTVIPGTKKVSDATYLEVMQWVNKKIINPIFFVIFIGPGILLAINAVYFEPMAITSAVFYIFGTIGITMAKNVPLNDKLEAKVLSQMSEGEKSEFRKSYELVWNRWHYIRTVFSVLSFILIIR